MPREDIQFVGRVLDNVHGFINYTSAEQKIMDMLLFKRLQSIKQLSLVNWVFPGSEHTRFIHSLGVMHIADKIAVQLNLPPTERLIVRLAGLLHDIGHYPLSHVCEFPYKKQLEQYSPDCFCHQVNTRALEYIKDYTMRTETEFMKSAKLGHHEEIGALLIKNDPAIIEIIKEECGEDAVDIICDMITGNIDMDDSRDSLLVQILHSELDADGIDYMLRDAVFSGTSFGSFEVEQLIRSMTSIKQNGKDILCISPKGIAAADQYLINKFFSYSQVVFNKHTTVLEWMAEQIVAWMQENSAYFPRKKELRNTWIINDHSKKRFIDFTDTFFWSSVKNITENPARETFPRYIIRLCENLLHHQELCFIDGSEVKIVSKDESKIKSALEKATISEEHFDKSITIINEREITKHVPLSEFEEAIKRPDESEKIAADDSDDDFLKFKENQKTLRLMDGICVNDETGPHLLCDDPRSLMQQLCHTRLVVKRSYDFPPDSAENVLGN